MRARNIAAESDSAEYLRKLCLREGRTELRACYPTDICNILTSIGRYESRARDDEVGMERAAQLYFAKTQIRRDSSELRQGAVTVAARAVRDRRHGFRKNRLAISGRGAYQRPTRTPRLGPSPNPIKDSAPIFPSASRF